MPCSRAARMSWTAPARPARPTAVLDVLHRSHAGVDDRVRTNKAMGLDNLPSQSWEVNRGWMLAANIAADLDAWLPLPALHDIDGPADAEPDTVRLRLYHLPTRLADHPRRRFLADRADLAVGQGQEVKGLGRSSSRLGAWSIVRMGDRTGRPDGEQDPW
jgi:Transposase DDE domain group 1